ncbi:hypothetical protein [Pandoraea captiosa]|jgi:hypothetical protein|uniref:hypothetical protein n=1 Tax=Pandoraea captiosa TaxID=2508302 RepID=UPI001583ECEB|nr:hypothetical protein [Pandoraea captiosa]
MSEVIGRRVAVVPKIARNDNGKSIPVAWALLCQLLAMRHASVCSVCSVWLVG